MARAMKPKDWEDIKLEVYRLYIVENKQLGLVQARLQAIHGFKACISVWKEHTTKWEFSKHVPFSTMHAIVAVKAERTRKRKRSVFVWAETPISQKKIENFAYRNRGKLACLPVPTLPSNVRYHTPGSDNEDVPPEETYEKLLVCPSTSSKVQSSSLGHACSVYSQQGQIESGEASSIDLSDEPQFPLIGSIDRWLPNKLQPWSHLELSCKSNYHDDTMVDDHSLSDELFREFGLPSKEDNVWPDFPNNVPQPFLESGSVIIIEQEDTVSGEDAFEDLSTIATDKLTQFLHQNQLYTPQALAEALIGIGKVDEAEKYCRQILAVDSTESVAALLGTICAKSERLEESTTWWFVALANFILGCTTYSAQQMDESYFRVYHLLEELLGSVEQDWTPITQTMEKMMATLIDLWSHGDIHRACCELFIHGFHFARNCTAFDLVKSAKYLYQQLLEPSASYLKGHCLNEKAKAHQMYGQLLSGEENWSSSAEQLLLACESTIQSGTYTHQHAACLTITFDNLRHHLPSENNRPGLMVKTIETKLDYMKNKIRVSKNGFSLLPVENYLQSNLPGLCHSILFADVSAQAQLTLPVRTISNSMSSRRGIVCCDVRASKKSASTGPMSSSGDGSHEYGQTWPTSEWDEYTSITNIYNM